MDKLMAGCWTSSGACSPRASDDRSPLPIRRRVEAVAAAGFQGFGIRHGDLLDVEASIGLKSFKTMLEDHGLFYSELEFLTDWYAPSSPERDQSDRMRVDLLRAAEVLEPVHLKVGGRVASDLIEPGRVAEELRVLAQQAAESGTRVGLEPMPFCDVATPGMALHVVTLAEHPAAGLFLDIWHQGRAEVDFATLANLPAERIFGVELSDARAEVRGTLLDDTFDERLFPGEGSFDTAEFIRAVRSGGFSGLWGVEMLSTEFRALPVEVATKRAHDSLMSVLKRD